LTFLYIAPGSAGEVRSMLCVMERMAAFGDLKSEISNLKSVAAKIESPALTLCRRAAIIASQVTI
jgi:hypothetical protein